MRRSVHINNIKVGVQSKEKESEAAQETTEVCVICLDNLCNDSPKTARLDCCQHKYHFDCISKWVKEVESTCPQCKRQASKIETCGSDNRPKIVSVVRRVQDDMVA